MSKIGFLLVLSSCVFLSACSRSSFEALKPSPVHTPSHKIKTYKDEASAEKNQKAKGEKPYHVRKCLVEYHDDTKGI